MTALEGVSRGNSMTSRLSVAHIFAKIWGKSKNSAALAISAGILIAQSVSVQASAAPAAGTVSASASPSGMSQPIPHITTPAAPTVPSAASLMTPSASAKLAQVVHAPQLIINVGNLTHGTYKVTGDFINSSTEQANKSEVAFWQA